MAKWELSTSLERCCERQRFTGKECPALERELLREFKRAYHHYSQHIPEKQAPIEWVALMQHHGAPTRLLDCTYSIYVAAYFALEGADCDCAVWAINAPWALRQSVSAFSSVGKDATPLQTPTTEAHEQISEGLLFFEPFAKVAVPLTPFRLNERLRTQRGTFLVPGDVTAPFMDNLCALGGYDEMQNVVKVVIPYELHRCGLEQLYSMNISRHSLFPGLDGYAQSLRIYHPYFSRTPWPI